MILSGAFDKHLRPFVPLDLRGPLNEVTVQAMVDTGFDGWLKLDSSIVDHLGLSFEAVDKVELADGSLYEVFKGVVKVLIDGEWREVSSYMAPGGTLIGTKLLSGHRLMFDVVPGGPIQIRPLPSEPIR